MKHDGLITVSYVFNHKTQMYLYEERSQVFSLLYVYGCFFFVCSSEEKDGETETKDEKGEWMKCFFPALILHIQWIYSTFINLSCV